MELIILWMLWNTTQAEETKILRVSGNNYGLNKEKKNQDIIWKKKKNCFYNDIVPFDLPLYSVHNSQNMD